MDGPGAILVALLRILDLVFRLVDVVWQMFYFFWGIFVGIPGVLRHGVGNGDKKRDKDQPE